MNPQIDPLILEKLQAFGLRRRRLIMVRGTCMALAALLASMMLIALVDWLLILPDEVRWGLSGTAYLAILIVEWRSCLHLLLHAPDPHRLARLVEYADPGLREDLLSAVELGEVKPGERFDSEEFRALVQSDVAGRVAGLDMERLLPFNLVRRPLAWASGILLICLLAFTLAGLQFGTLMIRALLPMANLSRVSSVRISIVEPSPAEMKVPQGDTVPLVIETGGRQPNKAVLETFTKTGGCELVQMNPTGTNRFSATIQVGREKVLYRVRAGDAITRKYQIEAVPRPAVVRFEKVYTYPQYSRLGVKRVIEENGDLSALEGTVVELRLRTNQKVKEAELCIEQGRNNNYTLELTPEGGEWTAKIPLTTSGIYRVHLVSADSGFENKFSPEYELRAEPDLVPQVVLDLPQQDLILPPNEIVDVQGSASDDLALARVSQLVKVNDGEWKETELGNDPGSKMRIDRRWDLLEQGLKPGDVVTLKLVATDFKGNRGESRSVQVTITARGFEFRRVQALEQQLLLLKTLQSHQAAAAALLRQITEARDQFARLPEGDAKRKQLTDLATAALEEFEHKNSDATEAQKTALHTAEVVRQTSDLVLLARSLARANADGAQFTWRIVDLVAANPSASFSSEIFHEAAEAAGRGEQKARSAFEAFRVFLTASEIDVLTGNFQVVAKEQVRLDELARTSGDDAVKWEQVAGRLRAVMSETRTLEEIAAAGSDHATGRVGDCLKDLASENRKLRETIGAALAAKAPGRDLLAPTLQMTPAYAGFVDKMLELQSEFQPLPEQRYALLLADTHPVYETIERLGENTRGLAHRERLPVETREALIAVAWDSSLQILKSCGDAEERRVDSDTYFVNDLRLTSRLLQALDGQRSQLAAQEVTKRIETADRDFRLLETGHNIEEVYEGLLRLANAEKWEIYTPLSRTTNPRDWARLNQLLIALPEEVARSVRTPELRPITTEVQRLLRDAAQRPEAQQLAEEMRQRFDARREPVSASQNSARLASCVKSALDLIRKPVQEARNELVQMSPKLGEIASHLAEKTEKLKEDTATQAENHGEIKLSEPQKTLADQQKLNREIETLQDALRADANQQDILKEEGRARARDADDALAMLKEPPARAEQNLARAAASDQAPVRKQAMQQAVAEQQKLEDALRQITQHYDNVENGRAEESRTTLRATEEPNGVKENLDKQFAAAAEMAEMAQASSQELLAKLEHALPKNPLMQKELSEISKNTLAGAQEKLKQAGSQENTVARQVEKMSEEEQAKAALPNSQTLQNPTEQTPGDKKAPAKPEAQVSKPEAEQLGKQPSSSANQPDEKSPQNQGRNADEALANAAKQQQQIADAARQAGGEIERAARHEQRLQNNAAEKQLHQLGESVKSTAAKEVPEAGSALENARQAEQARPAVKAADVELQKNLAQLAAMANASEPENAGTPTEMPTRQADEAASQPASPPVQQAMARALDAADAAVHTDTVGKNSPPPTQGGKPEAGQAPPHAGDQAAPEKPDGAAQQAQASMTAAAQAAAEEMRAKRSDTASAHPGNPAAQKGRQAVSKASANTGGTAPWTDSLDAAKNRGGEWGKLPKQMAEQLSQGEQEKVSDEYRRQVETYYRVIAEKSKKP